MADYKTTTVAGTSYIRAREVQITNRLDAEKRVMFIEERALILDGGEVVMTPIQQVLEEVLNEETAATVFPLLDATGEPTGATATYTDVYLMLQSLYYYVAQQRDLEEAL